MSNFPSIYSCCNSEKTLHSLLVLDRTSSLHFSVSHPFSVYSSVGVSNLGLSENLRYPICKEKAIFLMQVCSLRSNLFLRKLKKPNQLALKMDGAEASYPDPAVGPRGTVRRVEGRGGGGAASGASPGEASAIVQILVVVATIQALKCKPSALIFGRGRAKKSIALQGSYNIGIIIICQNQRKQQALLRVREALTKRTR